MKKKKQMFQHPDWLELDRERCTDAAAARLGVRTGRDPALSSTRLFQASASPARPSPTPWALLEKAATRVVYRSMPVEHFFRHFFRYLRQRHSFWGVFTGIVISGAAENDQTRAGDFHHLLQRYGLKAARPCSWMTMRRVEAARELGIHTVWFKSAGQC